MENHTTSHGNRHKILFMDDEPEIRNIISEFLSLLGMETVCAKDGEEALALIERERAAGGKFSAIILDLIIHKGMGGREVVARIRETDMVTPVILASGYSGDPVLANPLKYGFSASINKPYTIKDVKVLLDQWIGKE
jgi:CheY-like chemotaxis protein